MAKQTQEERKAQLEQMRKEVFASESYKSLSSLLVDIHSRSRRANGKPNLGGRYVHRGSNRE